MDLFEILKSLFFSLLITISIFFSDEFAKNPNLPVFRPIMGIDNSPIFSTEFKIVPSPPTEIAKS